MHVLQRTRHLRHPLAYLARVKAWRELNTTAAAAAAAAAAATAAAAGRMPQGAVTAAGVAATNVTATNVAATNVAALGLRSYGGGERAAASVLEDYAERALVLVGGEVRDNERVRERAQ